MGALLIAAVSTIGDFIWAGLQLRHRVVYGLAHGALLFLCIGAYLGALKRQRMRGAAAGALIGFTAAGAFYVLARVFGYAIMFPIWAFIWLALAALSGRVTDTPAPSSTDIWKRGALAMVGSGIAFYLISGIWRPFDPQGLDYLVHFVAWTIAYLPGFAALLLTPRRTPAV